MRLIDDYGAGRLDYYRDMILRMNLGELMNDSRISRLTDRLLWRLELALGEIPMGHLLEMLESGPYLDPGRLNEIRAALGDEALARVEHEEDC